MFRSGKFTVFRAREGGAGIGGGIRHDESGAPLFVQRGVKMLDPEVVAIVGARVSGEALLVDFADIEGRVGQQEVEAADGVLEILVVGVPLLDIAARPVRRRCTMPGQVPDWDRDRDGGHGLGQEGERAAFEDGVSGKLEIRPGPERVGGIPEFLFGFGPMHEMALD